MNKNESSYRWVVFGSVLVVYFLVLNQRTAPGLITEQLMKDFQVSASTIGLVTSIQFLAYAGLQIPAGLLADRFGPARFLIIGAFLNGLGSLIYSFAANEFVLIFSRFLVGIGDGAIFVNFVIILSQWFKAKEYLGLLGVISMVGALGFLSATVPFSMFISFVGWRMAFLTMGISLIVLSCLLYIVIVSKPKQIFHDDSKAVESHLKDRENVWLILRRMFSNPQAWAAFFCHFGVVGAYVGFISTWGVPYGIHVYELSRSEASQLMMYSLFGAMMGGPLISWITSQLNSMKKIYTLVHLIVWFSWIGLFLSGVKPPFMIVVALLFIIGFGMGASSLTFSLVRESFPMKEVGVVSGFANMGGFLSAVLLPSVFGSVLDLFSEGSITMGYHYGFLIPVLFSLMGLFGVIMFKVESKAEKTVISAS